MAAKAEYKKNGRGHNPLLGFWCKLYFDQTPAEKAIEPAIASLGIPYRFQHIVSMKFIIDYMLPTIKVAIEIDGLSHRRPAQIEKDVKKTAFLEEKGWRVIRILNEDAILDPYYTLDYELEKLGLPNRTRK